MHFFLKYIFCSQILQKKCIDMQVAIKKINKINNRILQFFMIAEKVPIFHVKIIYFDFCFRG